MKASMNAIREEMKASRNAIREEMNEKFQDQSKKIDKLIEN